MKNRLFAILALVFLLLVALPIASQNKVAAGDEPMPCDPSPSMVRMCQLKGGTFDYATCRCVFP